MFWAETETAVEIKEYAPDPCTKVKEATTSTPAEYDCTESAILLKKWAAFERQEKDDLQNELEKLLGKKIKAIITKYSRVDSCHNPKIVHGKKLCLTAIGRDTQEGITVACPRFIKLGTKVEILGKTYICEDRYSAYLDKLRKLPTFDIFLEKENLGKMPGKQIADVTIR